MTKMKRSVVRQSLIFVLYLFTLSFLLQSHKGGEDIFFMFLMIIALCLHILVVSIIIIIRNLNQDKKINSLNKFDFFTVLTLSTLFLIFSSKYLSFMWWLTNV